MDVNKFPEIIKKMRESKGISQRELAKRLGISNRAISKWENGLSFPTMENVIKLSEVFGTVCNFYKVFEEKPDSEKQGMESLKELYKIGRGPSSSHTIGPEKACTVFKSKNKDADCFKAILYGSLAKTGKGHGTDEVIRKTFLPQKSRVEYNLSKNDIPHPNTMELYAFKDGKEVDFARIFSVGGGRIEFENFEVEKAPLIYSFTDFKSIAKYCSERKIRLWQYAEKTEEDDFLLYMKRIWNAMKKSIESGLKAQGVLPGGLEIQKKAKYLHGVEHIDETPETRENRIVCSYAFAVSEENASGEKIVTAPTCGAAGVLPAVLYYQQLKRGCSDDEIIKALITGGIIGNLIKTNASISGAECGCQAEIGTACAMAAAALGELFGLNTDKIEYAAEIAIEHHLGLTCDPIAGLVQIPCIERNAVAAMRAINAVNLASFLSETRKISLDEVIRTMKETGRDLSSRYKETSEAGLAKLDI